MKRIGLIWLIIILSATLLCIGCADSDQTKTDQTKTDQTKTDQTDSSAPEKILVGSVASLTGNVAGFGVGGVWGLKAAVEDINNLGGVFVEEFGKKIPIELRVVNCESDPPKARSLCEKLVLNDKVDFFVHCHEPITMQHGKYDVAEQYKVPTIAGTGPLETYLPQREVASPTWTYSWGQSFSIATPPPEGDPRHGKPGYTILETWKGWLDMFGDQTNKTAAVFALDDPDGRAWYQVFSEALKGWGYTVVGAEENLGLFPPGTNDFSSVIQKWKAADAQILWGNCPGPDFGILWRQADTTKFHPKMVGAARASAFYTDIAAWGGDLPLGVFIELWWHPDLPAEHYPGIGGTTPQSLNERWFADTKEPFNINIGASYCLVQVLVDAIERAGTLDKDAVNAAIKETNLDTIAGLIWYSPEQFTYVPLTIGQWVKTDESYKWEQKIVFSEHDFIKPTIDPVFPIPHE